jgi:hypothetical protein
MQQHLRTRTNLVLLGVLVLALFLLIGLLTFAPSATKSALSVFGVTSTGDEEQARIDDVTNAARTEVAAAYTSDYRKVDDWATKVTAGATGSLLDQLQTQLPTTKATIYQNKVVGTGEVTDVGINQIKAPGTDGSQWTALAFVSVNTRETRPAFKAIEKTADCPAATLCGRYVLEVDLIQTTAGWKVSKMVPAS